MTRMKTATVAFNTVGVESRSLTILGIDGKKLAEEKGANSAAYLHPPISLYR